jgi:hypothetical protein
MRKGQAAFEFLTTYWWAFIAVMAVIGVLYYFGVFSPNQGASYSCFIPAGLDCVEHKISSDMVRFYIINNLGGDIDISDVKAITDTGVICSVSSFPISLKSQAKTSFNITDCITGSSFKARLEITYKKADEFESHIMIGSIMGKAD